MAYTCNIYIWNSMTLRISQYVYTYMCFILPEQHYTRLPPFHFQAPHTRKHFFPTPPPPQPPTQHWSKNAKGPSTHSLCGSVYRKLRYVCTQTLITITYELPFRLQHQTVCFKNTIMSLHGHIHYAVKLLQGSMLGRKTKLCLDQRLAALCTLEGWTHTLQWELCYN
jgi:hypothetical protein